MNPAWDGELRFVVDRVLDDQLGPDIERDAKRYCPVDTGHLRRTIYHEMRGETLVVGATAHYAAFVEEGARPHVIRPDSKKALYWPTADHPVAVVHHPGNHPEPFLRPALYQHRELGVPE